VGIAVDRASRLLSVRNYRLLAVQPVARLQVFLTLAFAAMQATKMGFGLT
jgi:hypothetical protein